MSCFDCQQYESDRKKGSTYFFRVTFLYASFHHYLVNDIYTKQKFLETKKEITSLINYLFVPNEIPIKLIESLDNFNSIEKDFVFQLLQEKNVKDHPSLPLKLTDSDINLLKNFPVDIPMYKNKNYFKHLIFITKCLNAGANKTIFIKYYHDFGALFFLKDFNDVRFKTWLNATKLLIRLKVHKSPFKLENFLSFFSAKIKENEQYCCRVNSLESLDFMMQIIK